MSQHIIEISHNNTPTRVLLGFDRPLQYFFMVVTQDEADDEPVYSNLFEEDPFSLTLDDYRQILAQKGITVPDVMFQNVLEDAANNVGNKQVVYQMDGSFVVQ